MTSDLIAKILMTYMVAGGLLCVLLLYIEDHFRTPRWMDDITTWVCRIWACSCGVIFITGFFVLIWS